VVDSFFGWCPLLEVLLLDVRVLHTRIYRLTI
jgi:hypothetical protein